MEQVIVGLKSDERRNEQLKNNLQGSKNYIKRLQNQLCKLEQENQTLQYNVNVLSFYNYDWYLLWCDTYL